jgi:hypothetical protein
MMRVGPRVAATAYEGKVFIAQLPDGPIRVLEGTAALIWTHALAVPRSGLVAALAEEVVGDPATVEAEVSAFVDALLQQRLLVEDGEA